MIRLIDNSLLLLIVCTFLLCSSVHSFCPASADARALTCRHTYVNLPGGNVSRNLDIFAGKLTAIQCIAHCGCLPRSYAGIDTQGYCFCGNNLGYDVNCSSTECLRLYSTVGIPSSPSALFVSKVQLFSPSAVTMNGALTKVTTFTVVEDYKLTYFSPSTGSITFVQTGDRKALSEVEGYWGCQTPASTVKVYSKLVMDYTVPKGARAGEEFDTWVDIIEGSEIQSIQFKLDGSPLGSPITYVGEPLLVATGAEMAVDRYENYGPSFVRTGTESKTYININYEFHDVCTIRAFEAYATKTGPVRFQVFKPMCDQMGLEKTYCHSQKKCVSSGCGTPVDGQMEYYPPASTPVFCLDVIRFKADDNSSCTESPIITSAGADYMLDSEFLANLTHIGNNVVEVPALKKLLGRQGYVIAWTSGAPNNDSGDIASEANDPLNNNKYPEYEFSEIYGSRVGSIFARTSPTLKLYHRSHLFRAHSICATKYLKKVTLPNLGQPYTLGVTITAADSTASASKTVLVEKDITSLTFSAAPNAFINADVAFSTQINTEAGTFSYHFGESAFNGTFDATTTEKTFKKKFAKPGSYFVICRAFNFLGYIERNLTVNVFAPISKLDFLSSVDPEPTGNISTSVFHISGGGAANVIYEYGDGSAVRTLNVTISNHFFCELQHIYPAEGDYLIKVTSKTPLETKTINQYACVEDVIKDLVIPPPGVAATNTSHLFNITKHIGTNVTYVWNWNDSTTNSQSAVNQRYMWHNYTTYGNRTVQLHSYNKISKLNTTVFIEVQDVIKGLNVTQPEDSAYKIKPANESTKSHVWFYVEQGTGMDISVDWDSEKPKTRVSTTAFDMDKYGLSFNGVGTHQYTTIGYYNVTVFVKNDVSNASMKLRAIYETPVSPFTEVMRQLDSPDSYIEVNETVCFDMNPSLGTSVLIKYDFNDTKSAPVTTPNRTVCHSWPYWQLPFNCKFEIYNNVSSIKKTINVPVQRPVHEFKNLTISGGPENSTEPMELVVRMLGGDFFNCTLKIKDTVTVQATFLYDDYLIGKNVKHQFATPGTYVVDVFCRNRLYSGSNSTRVQSYKPASEFKVKVQYGGPCGAKKKQGDTGDGPDKDLYAFGCPLEFSMEEQIGSNITYDVDFGDSVPTRRRRTVKQTKMSKISHTFKPSKSDFRTLTFKASNPTSQFVKIFKLRFMPRISGIKVGNNGPIKTGIPLTLNLTVEEKGLESCFIVTIEYEISKNTGKMESTQFWLGDTSCQFNVKYKEITAKPDLNPTSAKWTRIFNQVGEFRVTVVGENSVSEETGYTTVTVLDKPCFKPDLSWMNLQAERHTPTNITKSKSYRCQVKVDKKCEKTDKVYYFWNVTTCDTNRIIKNVSSTKFDTALKIPKRTLAYGCYQVSLSVCMAEVFPKVCSPIIGYFLVNPSPLVAAYVGGTGRAAGKDRLIDIKATASHDPDVGETSAGLQFSWYCRQQSEKFPKDRSTFPESIYPSSPLPVAKNSSLNFTTSNFEGCFGIGMGELKSCFNKPSCIVNSTFMVLSQYYTVQVVVCKPTPGVDRKCESKDYTLFIVPGDPPQIRISPLIAAVKVDAFKDFKCLATCAQGCDDIVYTWSMERKPAETADDKLEKVADFESAYLTTAVDNKNLVVKANSFQTLYQYVLKLSGYPRKFPQLHGFSMYSVTINEPPVAPANSNWVIVVPKEGQPLQNTFKVLCKPCTDEDGFVSYSSEFRAKSTDKWQNFYNGIQTASPLSMFPEGDADNDNKIEIRSFCQDLYGSRSPYIMNFIKVKTPATGGLDLSKVLSQNEGSTDPTAASNVVNAVMSSKPSAAVVSAAADMLSKTEVNSAEGAAALAASCSKVTSSGALTGDAKEKALAAVGKVADFISDETPPDVVNSVTSNVFSVTLSATSDLSGANAAKSLEDSENVQKKLGMQVGKTIVPGEPAFVVKTGGSLLAVQSMDPGGAGGVKLGSGGFDMDSSLGGSDGAPFQALGGSGPNKFDKAAGTKSDVTSEVFSMSLAKNGKAVEVKNASKPIRIAISAPKNPYPLKMHQSYLDRVSSGHIVEVPNNESSLFLEIKNTTEMVFDMFVMIRKFKTPKMSDHHWNFTLPKVVSQFNPDGSNKTQKQLQTEMKNTMRIYLDAEKDLNSTAKGLFYVVIMNTRNNSGNATANITSTPVNYTMSSYSRSCIFLNKTTKKWSGEGLVLSQETDENFTICYTTHLSSFAGGGVFAKPNAIDFSKAFAGFSNIGDNPAVFSTVLAFIGLYFILLAYCRYKDKKDLEKIGVFPLEDNHPSDNYRYEVAVQTGFVKGSGTTADVFIILVGSLGETAPRKLKNPNRKCFNKGDTDAFLLTTPFSLGIIKEIEIWHNNGGHSPGWYCMQLQIRDAQNDKKWSFVCNKWLAVAEDDGLIKRTIEVARKDDLTQFDFLFAQTARKNLYDGHIWFSVFTRPPRSSFTRCQRLGCCLTLLFTSMLANAMFYKDPAGGTTAQPATDSIHLGPISISVDQIRIGITSSLVVIPVNIIIATLFQKAKPREEKPKKKNKYEADDDDDDEDVSINGAKSQPEISHSKISIVERGESVDENQTADELQYEKSKKRANFLKMLCMPGNEDNEEEASSGAGKKKKPKKKSMLPHWVIYIAYVLIFIGSGTSAFFVILYGFSFGKTKSEGWLQSMMISFWQSVFVIQPVKVVALSVLVAMIIKDPKAASGDEESSSRPVGKDEVAQDAKKKKKKIGENGEEIDDSDEDEEDQNFVQERPDVDFRLPDEKKLAEAREMRLKEKRMKSIIREIIVHLLFVLLCLFIGYSNMDPFANGFGHSVKSYTSPDLQKVTKVEEYWAWLEKKFIPYLYPGEWYNGNPNYTRDMVADAEPSKIISMARMRQLRVKKNSCSMHPMFKDIMNECNDMYSWSNEDTKQYSAGWKSPLNTSETRKLRARKTKKLWLGLENPWQHQSVLKLKNFPFMGKFATYSGSSYSVSIGPEERRAKMIVKDMKDNFWIDVYSRAIFVELNLYNANTNLMLIVTYVSEILPTGGWNYFDNVQAIRLYRWQGGLGSIIMVADLTLLIVTIVGLYKLVKNCRKEGTKTYLKNPWHILDLLVTVFSISVFACVAARLGAVIWAMKQYKNDPDVFVSFAYVGQLDYFVGAFIGFVVFIANLEFLRLLRFNRRIGLLTTTMKMSAKPLMSFGLIFFLIFLSYVSMAHFLFVDQLEEYRKLSSSIVALVKMFLGKFDLSSYITVAPVLGPFLFFSYMIVIQMVLINMFIGIICETFEEVRTDLDQQSNDHEILSFMTTRFKKMAGAAVGPGVDPIYREWKSEWEQTLDSIEEKSDSIVYLLRNVEAEEVRQTIWLEPTKANEKKRNLLKMLVGSDEFTYENEILDTLQVIDKQLKKMDAEKSKSMVYKMAKKKKKEKEEEMQSREEDSPNLTEEDESEDDDEDQDQEE